MSWFDSILGIFDGNSLADTLQTVSTVSTIIGSGLQAYGSYKEADASKEAAQYNAAAYEQNKQFAEFQAQDAINRGRQGENRARLATRVMLGAQRARMAANGIKLDKGSALDIQMDTAMMGELDAATIRENALREAAGYRNQGMNFAAQANLTRAAGDNISPFLAAVPSVISGAGSVADKWLRAKYSYGYGAY